ncbi:MAG: M16 family metallopeptidase [Thermoanaerobaculia bacterium]
MPQKTRYWTFSLLLAILALAPLGAQVETVDQLTYPALPDFAVPEPSRVVLDNGMVVILLEDHELPLIDVIARVRTGDRLEPADKVGLASLTGAVLRTGGTTSMTGDKIDDFLESRAASIETSIGTVSGSASMSCLKGDFQEVLGLFADVLRNPAFDEEKLAVAKNQANTSIARQNDQPQGILFREFGEIIYGADSPYARSETYTSVDSVTRDDLLAWHRTYYHPNNIILGLVGDFDSDEVLAQVREVFGDWPAGPPAPELDGGYRRQAAPGIYYVRKDDMTQSNIIMGHLGILRDNPDYLAVELMNEVLGGSFAARLFTNVRSKKGLAYAVAGGVRSNFDYPGTTGFFMTTKTETTAAGIDALLEEVRGMTATPPDAEEVQKALSGILNSFVFNSDSRRKILGQQLTYEYFGYPLDWLSRYYEGIQQVSVEAVREAAEKYLHPDEFAILVVGPAEGRDRPLEEFGEVIEVDISIPELDVEQVAATAESRQRGAALVERAVEAVGGAERLAAVSSLRRAGTAVATTPQGEMQIELAEVNLYPDRQRQEMTLPFGTMVSVVTADGGFMVTPQGVQDLPGSRLADTRKSMRRQLLPLLKARLYEGFEAVALGADEIAGRAVENVQVSLAGDVITLAIAGDNGEVVAMTYRGSGFGGAPGEVRQVYSDFREVNGLSLPHQVDSTFEGDPYIAVTARLIEVDGEVDEGAFERPAAEAPAAPGG